MRIGAVPARRIASVDEVDFERDVEAALGLVVGIVEIRQRRRIAGRTRVGVRAERRQRLGGHHPGRYRGGEILSPGTGPAADIPSACTSRADQSLSRQKPKMCSAALPTGTGSPSSLGVPM